MAVALLTPEQRWECPNCDLTQVTHEPRPHTRMHPCRGLRGITAPMVPAGTRCRVYAQEREDYVGNEIVERDGEGRPIMSVVTVREDGQDCTVFVPTAVASMRQLDIDPAKFKIWREHRRHRRTRVPRKAIA